MSAPLSRRLFGAGKLRASTTVADVLDQLRTERSHVGNRVVVASADDTVASAHELFQRFDLHHLPVVLDGQVEGIVSASDLLAFFASDESRDSSTTTLTSIMTPDPVVVRKDAPIREAVQKLAHASFRCLPVVNATGEIWDVITSRDMIRVLGDVFE